jgi:Tol biopolymer transport system component
MTLNTSHFGRSFLALLLAAVAAGLIVPVGAKPTKTAFPGTNGKIAFASTRTSGAGVNNPEGDSEIFTMNPDGTGLEQLTENAANDYDPAWSAQGDAIAFVSQRDNQNEEIYVMDADGTNQVRLTDNAASDRNPAFSPNPDGSRIAFTSTRVPSGSDIFVMGAVDSDNDGNGDNLVRFTGAQSDSSPAWSPDGTKIAFQSGRDDPQGDIYVMDAAPESGTNNALRLTDTTEGDFEPNWSPDGSKIVFTSGRDGNFEIYVMNADGSAPKRLTKKGRATPVPPGHRTVRRLHSGASGGAILRST